MNTNKLILLVLSFLIYSCGKEKEIYAKPIVEKTYNFGNIGISDTINHDFIIKNISKVPLNIQQIGTSCGCTAAIISDSIIGYKDFAKIHIRYVPNKRKIGNIKNSIVIKANTNPVFTTLYLIGHVK